MYAVVRCFKHNTNPVIMSYERASTPQEALQMARRNDRMPGPIGERGRPVGYVEVDHNGFQTPGSEIERF